MSSALKRSSADVSFTPASRVGSLSRIRELGEKLSAKFTRYEFAEDFMDKAPVPMQSVDDTGTVLWVNEAWLQEFGYDYSIIGQNISTFVSPADFHSAIAMLRAGAHLRGDEISFRCKDGSTRQVRLFCAAKLSNAGSIQHTRCVLVPDTYLNRS